MKFVIIGLGMISKYIIPAIEKYHELIAVCDIDDKKRSENHLFFTNYEEMLRLKDIDAVVICTSTQSRDHILLDVLKYNIPYVIVEKPLVVHKDTLTNINTSILNKIITLYHRTYNFNTTKAISKIKTVQASIDKIQIYYHENITLHTEDKNILMLPDNLGGGCINDNLPNCLDVLYCIYSEVVFQSIKFCKRNENNATEEALIEFLCDGIPCIISLSWISCKEEKYISLDINGKTEYFNMLQGFLPTKASLYHEYDTFFKTIENLDYENNLMNSKRNVELTNEIISAINNVCSG